LIRWPDFLIYSQINPRVVRAANLIFLSALLQFYAIRSIISDHYPLGNYIAAMTAMIAAADLMILGF
jgi:hypothetical protein